eukprot:Hpha_TRINITY_DN3584_c0_g1::TRINITY_DN3584_c0_g1_i1::g.25622::m.25622
MALRRCFVRLRYQPRGHRRGMEREDGGDPEMQLEIKRRRRRSGEQYREIREQLLRPQEHNEVIQPPTRPLLRDWEKICGVASTEHGVGSPFRTPDIAQLKPHFQASIAARMAYTYHYGSTQSAEEEGSEQYRFIGPRGERVGIAFSSEDKTDGSVKWRLKGAPDVRVLASCLRDEIRVWVWDGFSGVVDQKHVSIGGIRNESGWKPRHRIGCLLAQLPLLRPGEEEGLRDSYEVSVPGVPKQPPPALRWQCPSCGNWNQLDGPPEAGVFIRCGTCRSMRYARG